MASRTISEATRQLSSVVWFVQLQRPALAPFTQARRVQGMDECDPTADDWARNDCCVCCDQQQPTYLDAAISGPASCMHRAYADAVSITNDTAAEPVHTTAGLQLPD